MVCNLFLAVGHLDTSVYGEVLQRIFLNMMLC